MAKPWSKYAQGDCLHQLALLPDNSVDLIVTDPPYGLTSVNPKNPGGGSGSAGFMGKKWDRAVPPVAVWKECLRVLKPGAFAFIMSSPRQDCLGRMILNLEEAGFVTGFSSLYHIYASGLPKRKTSPRQRIRELGPREKW